MSGTRPFLASGGEDDHQERGRGNKRTGTVAELCHLG